jgi:hypothetical protein
MTRAIVGVVAILAGLSGCASPARYVEQNSDSGIVAIPAKTNAWPNYNLSAARELIEKHVGPNYEIVEEREVATGQQVLNNNQVNGNQSVGQTTTQNLTEWRIAYRKKAGPMGGGLQPVGGIQPMRPLPGSGPAVQPAGGIVPSMGPGAPLGGVVPAGGLGMPPPR